MSRGSSFSGKFWTVAPAALAYFRPPAAPPHEPFRLVVEDPTVGAIALSGALHAPPAARTLVVALHGLGGSAESSYMRQLATAAVGAGCACLRLNHRGAEREAQDYYHAGLTADLESVLAAEELARFERVAVVGFSLGGHVALRYAAERPGKTDPRLAGVAAVCAPLDLDRGATALDEPSSWLYRRYILPGLQQHIDAVEKLRPVPADRARRARVRGIREWDDLVVAPRWGFASAEDYYARASVAPILDRIALPAWIIESQNDPMVPVWTLQDALARVSPTTEVTWTPRGGHVGMPADLDLGRPGAKGLHPQLLAWLGAQLAV
ncbi:MAG: alpha/beta fold hydrolase [Thermoanaerobaculia bacterium]|nr:alpha/beta fold hydrolase [Thermoanaerobaculia bacterium]